MPLAARGIYVLRGYADTREAAEPGQGTQSSQEKDVAAIYFNTRAGRGGYSDVLVSQSGRDWLASARRTIFVSYPLDPDHIAAPALGKMHATPSALVPFTRPYFITNPTSQVFRTTTFAGVSGSSGGPVCVQWDDGHFYPAGIYLGGNEETIVRAIDTDVFDLIGRADVSSRGGGNNNNGGIVQVTSQRSVASFTIGRLRVNLAPAQAVAAGAQWRLTKETASALRSSGATVALSVGSYTLTVKDLPGFKTPSDFAFSIDESDDLVLTATYGLLPGFSTTVLPDAIKGTAYSARVAATNNPTSFSAPSLASLGLAIDTSGRITGTPTKSGLHHITIVVSNATGSVDQDFTLIVREPGVLVIDYDGRFGKVTGKPGVLPGNNTEGQGAQITLTAVPKTPGFVFNGWTLFGVTPSTSDSAKVTFTMPEFAIATASFIPNPFLPLAGSFSGLIAGNTPAAETSGLLAVKLMTTGAFTGTLKIGGLSYTVKGTFDVKGDAKLTIPRKGLSPIDVTLHLDVSNGTQRITGSVSIGGTTLALAADRASFDGKTHAAPQVGAFTLALPSDPTHAGEATYPQGHGYGVGTVSAAGAVKFTGALGDGTAITLGGSLASDGSWPIYLAPYAGKGALAGTVTFHPQPGVLADILDGALYWSKPATPTSKLYQGAFTGQIVAVGSRYHAPGKGARVIALPAVAPFAQLKLTGGGLGTVLQKEVHLDTNDAFTFTPSTPNPVQLKLTTSSGLLTGSLTIDATTKPVVNGVILQKQGVARGLLRGTSSTGSLELDHP